MAIVSTQALKPARLNRPTSVTRSHSFLNTKSANSHEARLSSERGSSPWRATILSQTGALPAIHSASFMARGTPQGISNQRASIGHTLDQRKLSPLVTLYAAFFPASCVAIKTTASARFVASESSDSTE